MFKPHGNIPDYDKDQLEECITALSGNYALSEVNDIELIDLKAVLNDLELLKGWSAVSIAQACLLGKDSNQVRYVALVMDRTNRGVGSKGQVYHHHITEAYQAFLVNMKADLGHIVIRPETIQDKINEIFTNKDIDFKDHPEFSKRYYALAKTKEDEELFRKNVDGALLDLIAGYGGLMIEIKNELIMVMTGKRINKEDSGMLAEFEFGVG